MCARRVKVLRATIGVTERATTRVVQGLLYGDTIRAIQRGTFTSVNRLPWRLQHAQARCSAPVFSRLNERRPKP